MDYWSSYCKSTKTLDGFTVVVTGGNTGIGKETALDLFRRGARVILASRNLVKTEKAKEDILKQTNDEHKGSVATEKLDLSSLQSVRECAFRILASEAKIDILINNAGIVMAPEGKTEDGYEIHIGTNHFGHALFTLLLLPRILQSTQARIVTVASVVYMQSILDGRVEVGNMHDFDMVFYKICSVWKNCRFAVRKAKMAKFNGTQRYPVVSVSNFDLEDVNIEKSFYLPLKAYARSKAANILFSRALHLKLRENNIRNVNTYSLHPGIVGTEAGRHLEKYFFYGMMWLVNVMRWFVRSPRCGAQTTLYCAIDDACANESGQYYDNCGVSRTYWQCSDDATALKLWDLTLEKLDIQDPFKIDLNKMKFM